ncbi:BMP family protein [Tistrella bauzanensis]|jgi:basic membrane protein A|uniref:BMP family protein n=1 Tax=Tistrella arctica TaxID=3133430 RepID=A0ABU9YIW5_9PROT
MAISRLARRLGMFAGVTAIIAATAFTAPAVRAADEAVRVAAVLPGSIRDQAWNQSAYEGLMKAKETMGLDVAYAEGVAEPDQLSAMRDFARRGYGVVIGHGGEFQDPAEKLARQFKDTLFVVSSGAEAGGNVATINFDYTQLGYVLGYMAAKLSTSGTIGWLGATEIKFSTELVDGYTKGAEAGRPGTKVLVTYMGDWNDVAKGKEAASAQISQGADVIFPTMDLASNGALTAAKEAGIKAFGIYYDAIVDWPDTVVQSVIMDVNAALVHFLEDAKAGQAGGKAYVYGLDTPDAARFGSFHADVPAEVKADVDQLISDLASGKRKI